MKRGPFAPGGLCCPADQHYYGPLRLPLGRAIHFPGSPVIGAHRFPPPHSRRGRDGSPQVPEQPSARSMPHTPEGPSASAPGSQTPSMAFTAHKPARHPLLPPTRRGCDDACSGFTHVTDRTVAPAPLRTRPLDHARRHSYQGPRHLPGPDSHRPAVLNLSLDLRHDELPFLTTPKQSGRTCATASREGDSERTLLAWAFAGNHCCRGGVVGR
jgi:hypothetical protein